VKESPAASSSRHDPKSVTARGSGLSRTSGAPTTFLLAVFSAQRPGSRQSSSYGRLRPHRGRCWRCPAHTSVPPCGQTNFSPAGLLPRLETVITPGVLTGATPGICAPRRGHFETSSTWGLGVARESLRFLTVKHPRGGDSDVPSPRVATKSSPSGSVSAAVGGPSRRESRDAWGGCMPGGITHVRFTDAHGEEPSQPVTMRLLARGRRPHSGQGAFGS